MHTHMHTHSLPHTRCTLARGGWISAFSFCFGSANSPPVPTSPTANSCPIRLPPPSCARGPAPVGAEEAGKAEGRLTKRSVSSDGSRCTWTQSTRAASGQSRGAAREGGRGRASMGGRRGPPRRGITGVPGGVGEPGRAPRTPPRAQPQAGHSGAWPGSGPQTPPPSCPRRTPSWTCSGQASPRSSRPAAASQHI